MNLVQKAVFSGGKLAPLVIPYGLTSGTGLMNPSVFLDDDGDILVNLRHTNYTLYHSENKQRFPSKWGPLSYLHPETDQKLITTNYICRLSKNLLMTNFSKVDTSEFDVEPMWDFVGQEDCRLVQWDGEYYLVGVRRDTTANGQGRMEYSKVSIEKGSNWSVKEISRIRIPAPGKDDSYCEKNWVPILDKSYHFIKWASPVEVVKANPDRSECIQIKTKQCLTPPLDQRGGSQVVRWRGQYISISHDVLLFNNYLGQKDAVYKHRLLVWDDELNLIGISNQFSFLDGLIEFCAGAAVYKDDLLISFGFQDNAAFVLKTPAKVVDLLVEEALKYGN